MLGSLVRLCGTVSHRDIVKMHRRQANSQFDGFVPHDGVTRQRETLDVHHMNVAMVRSYVNPLRLERKMTERYPTYARTHTCSQF